MSALTRPMKGDKIEAFDLDTLAKLRYPVLASVKLDGIRCLKVDGRALSKSFKPIRNDHIRAAIEQHFPEGCDGEIMPDAVDDFGDVASAVMKKEGEPAFKYAVFDWVKNDVLTEEYRDRYLRVSAWSGWTLPEVQRFGYPVEHILCHDAVALHAYILKTVEAGHEGVMIRSLTGPYKNGKSTLREQHLVKIKPFQDAEARIVDFQELERNHNEQKLDAFGLAKRSTHKDNKVAGGTLGALIVETLDGKTRFNVGTGFTAAVRAEIWASQDKYRGKLITYKYLAIGMQAGGLPRHPGFKCFRDQDDMDAPGTED